MTLQKIIAPLFLALSLNVLAAVAQEKPVMVSVKTADLGMEISPHALGLSYETSLMRPGTDGVRYFRPDNKALVILFKTLGIKSLRIGGASVESTKIPAPGEEDIASLFDFAKEAGVKVIYSVRGSESKEVKLAQNVELATKAAALIRSRYREQLDLFAIGNGTFYWPGGNDKYITRWITLRDAVVAGFPEARFCATDGGPISSLIHKLASAAAASTGGRLVTESLHHYPFGAAYKHISNPSDLVNGAISQDPAESRAKMLSPAAYATYDHLYKLITGAIAGTALSYHITECNSLWASGLKGASDSYASALWAADYMYWWASHGVDGLNFHTGDRTGGDLNQIAHYAAFRSNGHGYDVQPLSYGMKLFELGGHGRIAPTTVKAAADQNLVVWATLAEKQAVAVTLINKTFGPEAKEQVVKLKLDQPLEGSKVQMISLRGRNNDVSGGVGDVTLGDALIKEDGTWSGQWTELPSEAISQDVITVTMLSASAAVIKLRTQP